ncbi:hypothetical protein GOV11_02725 [Candidatus Woesearchaeota archaeon]|nr:hypothetical protein [Candidatus Woesearchaeota archaeon]
MTTTIKLHIATKSALDGYKEAVGESYDEVIKKLIYIAKVARHDPKLSKETVIQIEKARTRLKKGQYLTEAQAKKKLGL